MMASITLEQLADHFSTLLSNLRLKVDLQNMVRDGEGCGKVLRDLNCHVQELHVLLTLLRSELSEQRQALKSAEGLKAMIDDWTLQLHHALNNIPARLPKPQRDSRAECRDSVQSECRPVSAVAPVPNAVLQQAVPARTKQNGAPVRPDIKIRQIEYIIVNEFDNVPKYMKGRIPYDQVNSTIDLLNAVYVSKYKLLAQKKSTLNDKSRTKVLNYQSQQNKDSQGFSFIVDEDLKITPNLKLDGAFRSIMTILRHCGRIKEFYVISMENPVSAIPQPSLDKLHPHFAHVGIDRLNFQKTMQQADANGSPLSINESTFVSVYTPDIAVEANEAPEKLISVLDGKSSAANTTLKESSSPQTGNGHTSRRKAYLYDDDDDYYDYEYERSRRYERRMFKNHYGRPRRYRHRPH